MRIDIATLFTQMCDSVLSESIIGRARANGFIEIHTHDIRLYTENKHRRVDDKPYGGGTGMVMQAQPVYDCVRAIIAQHKTPPRVIYLSPQGDVLTQAKVKELAAEDGLVLLCGHYEGIDQRVLDELGAEELSVGDYVLTGGELPALIVADAVARMQPGVLPNEDAYSIESHFNGLLEYPQYTRPEVWRGREVPKILLGGSHSEVKQWQRSAALRVTAQKRPDMHQKYLREITAEFWQGFLNDSGIAEDAKFVRVRCGHDEQSWADEIKQILRGKKRTSLTNAKAGDVFPQAGDYRIVVDGDGIPRCVVQITRVRFVPFAELTPEMCERAGSDREALDKSGNILVEDFKVVYKKK